MYATSERQPATLYEPCHGRTGFLKMLGALATGAGVGLLVGLFCGRGGHAPGLCTIVQGLAAFSVFTGAWIGSLRRPAEPFCAFDVSICTGGPANVFVRTGEA